MGGGGGGVGGSDGKGKEKREREREWGGGLTQPSICRVKLFEIVEPVGVKSQMTFKKGKMIHIRHFRHFTQYNTGTFLSSLYLGICTYIECICYVGICMKVFVFVSLL